MKQLFANSVLVEPVLPPAAQLGIHSLKRLILKIELLFLEGPKFTSTSPSSEGGRGKKAQHLAGQHLTAVLQPRRQPRRQRKGQYNFKDSWQLP